MDNELIQLFFNPETENIDWEKRKPRINPPKQTSKNSVNNNNISNISVKQSPDMLCHLSMTKQTLI